MTGTLTRRDVLVLSGAGIAAALAGCAGTNDDGASGNGGSTTTTTTASTDQSTTTDEVSAGATIQVGERASNGDLSALVTDVEYPDRAPVFGISLAPEEGNEFVAPTMLLKNEGASFIAVSFEAFDALAGGQPYDPTDAYTQLFSADLGGLALAPGELRSFTPYFEVPAGERPHQLSMSLSVRTLPSSTFVPVSPLTVDLGTTAETAATLTQELDVDFETVGEVASFEGLDVLVRSVSFHDEVPGWQPDEESEYVALNLEVTHGAAIPNPVLANVGGFGGMSLGDDTGNRFTDTVRFSGEFAGGRAFETSSGIDPGETREGVTVVEVPRGVTPLYLLWTPPTRFWNTGSNVAENRVGWQLR